MDGVQMKYDSTIRKCHTQKKQKLQLWYRVISNNDNTDVKFHDFL